MCEHVRGGSSALDAPVPVCLSFLPSFLPNVTPQHSTVRTRTVAQGNQHERCAAVSLQTCGDARRLFPSPRSLCSSLRYGFVARLAYVFFFSAIEFVGT